ncbi:MAG: hypothetical protein AAF298_00370 [Cyanobacteria bacterium P01_A01_bin.40]
MKTWYQNRMEAGVTHRGQNIPEGKKLYLTEAQAEIHNGSQQKVAECEPPKESKEAGVLADWDEYDKLLKSTNNDPANTKKSGKANR